MVHNVGVTPGTVARAYALMTDEGRLTAGVGRGTFVAERAPRRSAADVPLINKVYETIADFRSSRMPDVGQGRIIDDALMQVAQSHRRRHINYPTFETDLEVREALVGWLSDTALGTYDASHIVLANGVQNARLICLMATLSGANPMILCEDLAYPGVRDAARLLRAQVVSVPMDDQGILPEALAQIYRQHGGQVLVTSPSVHSPTTISTPLERKLAIAEVARRLNLTLPERWRAARFMAACEAQDVLVKPADEFALPDGRAPNAVRLAIGTVNSDTALRAALLKVDHILSNPQSRIDG